MIFPNICSSKSSSIYHQSCSCYLDHLLRLEVGSKRGPSVLSVSLFLSLSLSLLCGSANFWKFSITQNIKFVFFLFRRLIKKDPQTETLDSSPHHLLGPGYLSISSTSNHRSDRGLDRMSLLPKSDSIHIREVWDDNLEEEFALIRNIVDDYPYVAMDTEFPGIVVRPVGNFKNSYDYHYRTLKENVDMLKLIQLGLTFSDEHGNLPTCGTDKHCIWQFNFREFNLNEDVFANDSIELLRQSGIDFKMNNEKGIDAKRFGELLMSSGVVLNYNVHWVTFHSGYDFGYLLKLLTCRNLPETQQEFFELINTYFPTVYDIKHLMKFCNSLHGGLNKLAELLEVERIGVCHQAGSDSLLTSCTFRKLKENFFSGSLEKYAGVLYGLGVDNGQSVH